MNFSTEITAYCSMNYIYIYIICVDIYIHILYKIVVWQINEYFQFNYARSLWVSVMHNQRHLVKTPAIKTKQSSALYEAVLMLAI